MRPPFQRLRSYRAVALSHGHLNSAPLILLVMFVSRIKVIQRLFFTRPAYHPEPLKTEVWEEKRAVLVDRGDILERRVLSSCWNDGFPRLKHLQAKDLDQSIKLYHTSVRT